ncbi:flap endonuclease GEN-like 2 [Carex littledalei]|uniref:Single-strand DNA endonuclease 1 n=1 Tax=Carex littledalei TaxID=544730 RepID=A0A833RFV2_9POAL|nr:flap endonuclease GEN-like 2 [Carex littledalei]
MGVKNLWDILESCKKTLPLHHLQNKKLCVDLSCWLVQFATANRSPACVKDKVYLKSLFHRLRALIALNCSVIFVTDGSIPSIKLATYRRRLGLQVERVNESTKPLPPVPSLRRNKGSEFSCMMKEAKMLGMALGIPSLDGIEEAEAQCAVLNSASLCDGCFTSDSDIFLFGARTVYRDIILADSGYVVCYEMADIERKLGFGRNSLISLSLLLGSDYSNGVHGFGTETACRFVKSVGDDSVLNQMALEGVAAIRKKRNKDRTEKDRFTEHTENDICVKKPTNEEHGLVGSESQFTEVIDAFLNPKCHSPDSEAVQRACTDLPFLRSELQQLCEMFFGWSPEKTDEYILPKIAERDLRRFRNLTHTSSALGVDTVPVTCPVSAILKPRKVHGEEYYDVSWRNMEGLKVSSVPADLVQSACSEKIAEFLSKKDEEKHNKQKRKPKPAKQTNKAAINEVDKQFKELLITIKDGARNPLTDISNNSRENYVKDILEPDFFDLCTPSPPPRASKVAKSRKPIAQSVHLIEIIDSESDVSPGAC